MVAYDASIAAEQIGSRKRKRPLPVNANFSAKSSLAWKSCDTVDIEDLHGSQCHLLRAPIVPSQSAEEYPLTAAFTGEAREAELRRIPHRVAGGSTCTLSRYAVSRGRSRDSGKIIANPHPPDAGDPPRQHQEQPVASLSQQNLLQDTLHSHHDGRFQCLLERVNPEYFAQDKYKWHSSTAQGPDTSEMMLIDPESAQDFTALYTSDDNISHLDMSQYTLQNTTTTTNTTTTLQTSTSDGSMPEGNVPDLDGASSPSKSALSSPDSMLQPLPSFDRQASDATSASDMDAFEDVNQMFDWDGACASLVDDYVPDYKHAGPIMPRTGHYNTSLFRSIPTISARPPYSMGQSGSTIYHASHRMIESSRANHAHMQQTMASQHADEDDGSGTVCHNCGVTKTPLWRRTPDKRHYLCNACGLYLKQYKTMRPLVPRNRSHVPKKDEENIVCSNCEATKTSLWRKDEGGQVICNACGLYFKLHNKARPVAMRKEKISRRKRYRNLTSEMIDIHDPIVQSSDSPVMLDVAMAAQKQGEMARQGEMGLAPTGA